MTKTLLEHLLKLYPTAKRTTLRRMIQSGRVRINRTKARTLTQPIGEKDVVEIIDQPKQRAPRQPSLPIRIVHEDDDILVIDKPAGLLTSTVPREKRPTVLAMVREYLAEKEPRAQVGLIHRLDRDASGLLVFSKNHDAYLSLKRQFFQHDVDRIYLAVVHGAANPLSGMIDSRLIERADGSVHSTDDPRRGERAVTFYETISKNKRLSLLRVKLRTGKKHQIRAHLFERGVPIVNDPVYFKDKKDGSERLMLASCELILTHPRTGKQMTFKIDPPKQFPLV